MNVKSAHLLFAAIEIDQVEFLCFGSKCFFLDSMNYIGNLY
jgi:hypothetical protein